MAHAGLSPVIVLALLTACASTAPPGMYLPTYGAMNSRPTGLVEGTLIEANGCLWVATEEPVTRRLMLWPKGTSVVEEDGRLTVRSEGSDVAVGVHISAAGGEYGEEHYDFVVELIGGEVPASCRDAGAYWLGYDVQVTP